MPRIIRGHLFQYILLTNCCCEPAAILQKQHLSPCNPVAHSAQNYLIPENFILRSAKQVPCYIAHPSTMRFQGVYQHWYGPAKPPGELCLWRHNTLQLLQLAAKSYRIPQVYVRIMFQHLIEISALPGELTISCSWHGATSARQAAATQQCAITFCALSSTSDLFHVINYYVVG